MMNFSFSDLRTRLILLILIAILPALALTIYAGIEQRRTAIYEAEAEALSIAKSIASLQEQQINDVRQVLFTLSQLPAVIQRDSAACATIFAALLEKSSGYNGFVAALPNGDLFTSYPAITNPVNFSDRAWFKRLVQTRELVIGEYVMGRISGKPAVVVGYPVLDDQGQMQTVLAVGLDLEWLNTYVGTLDLPLGTTVKILDRNGTVLLINYSAEDLIGKSLPDSPLVAKILAEKQGTAQAKGLDGTPRLYGFSSLSHDQAAIHVLIGIPEKVAFGPAVRSTTRNLVLLGVSTVLALLLAWAAAELLIARPANNVLTAARQLSDGDLSARTGMGSGTGELARIAQAFDLMADSLQAREVESSVAAATLRRTNRALRTLSSCNEMVIRSTTETDLLDAICTILVQVGEYRLAWVGFAEQNEGKHIHPVAHAGFEQGYLESLNLTWADTEKGRGPTGTAIRTGTPSICNNILSDPKFATWRDEAIKRGYASAAALPLIANDETIGALSLCSAQNDAFDQEELQLLLELANDLAFGISHIRQSIEKEQADKALRQGKDRYKKLYAQSKKSEALYRSIIEASPDAIVIYDLQGRARYVSQMFTRIFEWTPEEVKAIRIPFVPDDEKQKTMQTIRAVVEDGTPCIGFESKRTAKSGRILDVSISASRYNDHKGQPTGTIAILRDISERKKMERHLLQTQKMEAIGTLAGGIAHDFNNILSAVIGFTELAMDGVERDSPVYSNLQEVYQAGRRATELVRQILTFSRQHDQEQKPINVKHIAKEVLKLMRATLPSTITIRDDITSKSLIIADPTQIHQLLMNLCTNAGHAMQENGGTLKVALSDITLDSDFTDNHPDLTPGHYLKLTVSDTGCGMSAGVLERIFDPFFTTKANGEGTGMGLSVVHGIVDSHGGTITVTSEPEKGTTVSIFIPVIETQIASEKTREEPIPTGTERILLVDDEIVLVKMETRLLESLGYQVTARTSSLEALELFKAQPDRFDLVITDMTMPAMTGDKMAQEMMRIRADIPIVLCTGFSAKMDEQKATAMGIRAFVAKPIIKSEIAQKIRIALDQQMRQP